MSNLIDRDMAMAAIRRALHADTGLLSATICQGIAEVLNSLPTAEAVTPEGGAYRCDPAKHKDCSKKGCYINGGDCFLTLHPEYATEERRER